jgi:D-alanine transaminase
MLVHVRDLSGMVSPQVEAGVAAVILPDTRWRRCDIKSTNLLANVLAKTRAKEAGAHEAILVDEEGYVTEAASMALFSVAEDLVRTTPLGPSILPSVSRGFVLEVAEDAGIPVRQERVALDVFREADEIFLASTTQAVCPVIGLDGVPVGDGNVGPVTKRLREGFRARVAAGDDAPR